VKTLAPWEVDVKNGWYIRDGMSGTQIQSGPSILSMQSITVYTEISANGSLALITVACSLLDRQLSFQSAAFEKEGGFTERLCGARKLKSREE
jgi:four helix bundle suffix protein